MIGPWFASLFNDPIYRLITLVVVVEFVIILVSVLWLFIPFLAKLYLERRRRSFQDRLVPDFFSALEDEDQIENWIRRARRYPDSVLRDFIGPFLNRTEGRLLPAIIRVYRKLGLLRKDVRALRSLLWHRRMVAVRRLLNVASESERGALRRAKSDRHLIKLLALQTLGRVGNVDDVLDMIRDHFITNRLMEQPFFVLFSSLPPQKFRNIMVHWDDIACPRMRRVLLIVAADVDKIACNKWLPVAARSPELELRIAACIAAVKLPEANTLPLLLRLSRDDEWEVRAQAARSLGMLRNDSTIETLQSLLEDDSFWSRQYAANALAQFGDKGRDKLEEVARGGRDAFARDTATQELQRVEIQKL